MIAPPDSGPGQAQGQPSTRVMELMSIVAVNPEDRDPTVLTELLPKLATQELSVAVLTITQSGASITNTGRWFGVVLRCVVLSPTKEMGPVSIRVISA